MININISIIAINAKYIHTPLAALSIAAACGARARVLDFNINQNEDYMLSRIYETKPDIAAFSCYIWNIGAVKRLVSALRKVLPDTLIVLGGPEVSYNPKPYAKGGVIVIQGEGERAFAEIVKRYERYGRDARVPGGGDAEAPDLAELPFAYTGYDYPPGRIIYYESQRGCPSACAYCQESASAAPYRDAPLARVFEQLKVFLDNRVPQVKFTDRTFNAVPRRAVKIWRFLTENDNGVTNFHFEIKGELIDEVCFKVLRGARRGLFQLEAGVQSTNPETLAAVNRRQDMEYLLNNISRIKEMGNIHTHISIIAGLPYEDYASFGKTFNDCMAAEPDMLQLGFLKLLHGSALRKNARKYGIVYRGEPPYEVLQTADISAGELFRLKRIARMADVYYNAEYFKETAVKAQAAYGAPFEFYEGLADYWQANGFFDRAHSREKTEGYLTEFMASRAGCTSNTGRGKPRPCGDRADGSRRGGNPPPADSNTNDGARTREILRRLTGRYRSNTKCYLNYTEPYELLFAAMLSAQCTDERVNKITETLFVKYPTLAAFADADLAELEEAVKSAGMYRTKAKNIKKAAVMIKDMYGGVLPDDRDRLISLPGVGRKTANVVLGHIYKIPCIVVDTHVARVSRRLGLTDETNPTKIEYALMEILPEKSWIHFNTRVIAHGRTLCTARSPKCAECFMNDICGRAARVPGGGPPR